MYGTPVAAPHRHRELSAASTSRPRKRPHHLDRIGTEGTGNLEKLDDVQPSFPTFVLGHEGLRPAEPLADLLLSEARRFACGDKQFAKLGMLGAVDRFAHAARGWGGERRKLIPLSDYPK